MKKESKKYAFYLTKNEAELVADALANIQPDKEKQRILACALELDFRNMESLGQATLQTTFATSEQIDRARELFAAGSNDELEIDDSLVRTSRSDEGTWVAAWVFLHDEEMA